MGHGEGAKGVNALVHTMQLSFANANRDRPRPQPRFFELPPRNDSMLPRGHIRHAPVGIVTFCAHMGA
jgi:hypothetical protein